MKKLSLFFILAILGFTGCDDSPSEEERINSFARRNDLDIITTESGLAYNITTPGVGSFAENGDTVRVDYVGFTMNGEVFDTSLEVVAVNVGLFNPARTYEPIEFVVGAGRVIQGWDEAMTLLNTGSAATILIPSNLAYGVTGVPPIIAPNSPIGFTVTLVEKRDGP